MELTSVQQRTLDGLIEPGASTAFPDGLDSLLGDRLDAAARRLDLSEKMWLHKRLINQLLQCEGHGQAALLGEEDAFTFSPKSATGTLLHKVIELEVVSRDELDVGQIAESAAERLREDEAFGEFWNQLDRLQRDEVLMDAVRVADQFRSTFPPLRELRRELSPVTELRLRAEFADGKLTVSGRPDLVLGQVRADGATRLLVDLKTGDARAEYPEDLRLYALIHTLRFGVPPRRVASLFLDSGIAQAEDVTQETLEHAADRVIKAAGKAADLLEGEPALTPGPYCSWCPRGLTCPESLARD
ncbi:MAG: PD-(D/E)XK nuclease family protein [Actinomycetota bacterium]